MMTLGRMSKIAMPILTRPDEVEVVIREAAKLLAIGSFKSADVLPLKGCETLSKNSGNIVGYSNPAICIFQEWTKVL